MFHILSRQNRLVFVADKKFVKKLKKIIGFRPKELNYYQLALIHKSASCRFSKDQSINNERLEFLGDAILDSVIAEHLYRKFPDDDEGFLTQLRSKIVNRDTLKRIAIKMGLSEMVISQISRDDHKSIFGDALEALVGAIYLDRGFEIAKKFIIKQIINHHINLQSLCETEIDFKSRIIEWGQKNRKDINFTCQEQLNGKEKSPVFVSRLLVFDEIVGMGMGTSKKEAEQNAARQAIHLMEL